jgi:IclR family transcriptional regulator, pca regulon regulatory protein
MAPRTSASSLPVSMREVSERPRDFVQSVERGLAVIRAFTADRPSLTVSEIAHEIGLTRTPVRRFVLTLDGLGYVQGNSNRFQLTPGILELGPQHSSSWTH